MLANKRHLMVMVLLILGLAATALISLCTGAVGIDPARVARILISEVPGSGAYVNHDWLQSEAAIVTMIRLPRLLLAMVVGASLALAGAIFQGLFRNPMADPQVIGASSGAALGAVIAILIQTSLPSLVPAGLNAIPLFAGSGAILTVVVVYNLARTGRAVPVPNLLLAGIAVQSFLAAITSLLIYYGQNQLHSIVFWLLGGLSGRDWHYLGFAFPCLAAGLAVTAYYSRDLNVMLIGDETATTVGVEVERVKAVLLFTASMLTGAAVAVSGVIGFVGLVVPHIIRILAGPDHRRLTWLSAIAGAILLSWSDLLARTLAAPVELPLGVVTALFGAPFFIFLLRRYKIILF